MYKTEKFTPADFKPQRFESDGTITLRGETIPYHTVSEDNVFYNNEGKPIASIFSYSYFRSDVEDPTSRPVLFGFNGGPRPKGSKPGDGFISAFPNAEEQAKQREWQALESVEPAPAEDEKPAE